MKHWFIMYQLIIMAFASLSLHLPSLNLHCGQHSQYFLYFFFHFFSTERNQRSRFFHYGKAWSTTKNAVKMWISAEAIASNFVRLLMCAKLLKLCIDIRVFFRSSFTNFVNNSKWWRNLTNQKKNEQELHDQVETLFWYASKIVCLSYIKLA